MRGSAERRLPTQFLSRPAEDALLLILFETLHGFDDRAHGF
jgi:hypothetical protein